MADESFLTWLFICQVFANYLLQRVADKEAAFQLRLHLIYLINDVLHHCQRKNVEGEALCIVG